MMESLLADFRFGARTLWKSRGFTIIAIVTLALGVGASSAIFSVIDNVLLEPFPYKGAHRLVSIEIHDTDDSNPAAAQPIRAPNSWTTSARTTCSKMPLAMPAKTSCIPREKVRSDSRAS